MIRLLFYRVVLTVTVSILFFIMGALNIESCAPWLRHYSRRIRRTDEGANDLKLTKWEDDVTVVVEWKAGGGHTVGRS
jgi:hypothetical protein